LILKKILNNFEKYICEVLISLIFIQIIIQIISRYIFKISFMGHDEFCRHCLVWFVYIGSSFVEKDDTHIKIELFYNILTKKYILTKKVFSFLKDALIFAFLVLLFKEGISFCKFPTLSFPINSPNLRIPDLYLYLAVPVGMLLFFIRKVQSIFRFYKHKKENN